MDEYIEREAAIAWFMPYAHVGESIDADVVISDIKGMKAVDVAPVVHGRWIYTGTYGEYECSVCHGIDTDCSDYYGSHIVTEQNFCPECGAKMDGGESNAAD